MSLAPLLFALAAIGCSGPARAAVDGDWLLEELAGGASVCDGAMHLEAGDDGDYSCGPDHGTVRAKTDGTIDVVLDIDRGGQRFLARGYSDGSVLDVAGGGRLVRARRREVRFGKDTGPGW